MVVQERGPVDSDDFDPAPAIKLFFEEKARRMMFWGTRNPSDQPIAACHQEGRSKGWAKLTWAEKEKKRGRKKKTDQEAQ